MNFSDLQTEFFESGFAYLNDNGVGTARAKRWLNQSYKEICALQAWPFLEATATGASPLVISTLGRVISVVDTTNRNTLAKSRYADLVDIYPDVTVVGSPLYWYQSAATTIATAPSGTSVQLSVLYIPVPTDLSNSNDTPSIPTAYHDIIVLGAWRRGLLDDSNAGDYTLIKTEWTDRIAAMKLELLHEPQFQHITGSSLDW